MERTKHKACPKITPERAMKILNSEGMNVTLEEAAEILHFVKKMANIAVSKFLES